MLQQTQVATVREYFKRFIRALPNVRRLAAADEQQVLKLWEGLGYYRRARQLHAAAKKIVAEFGGEFPRDVVDLQTLPGIGRYTAGAIASMRWSVVVGASRKIGSMPALRMVAAKSSLSSGG